MNRARTFRRLFFGAAPLALAAGIFLRLNIEPPPAARLAIDREQAIELSRRLAHSLAVTPGSRATVKVVSAEPARIYNLVHPDSPVAARLFPPYSVEVSFTASEGEGVFKASLTPSGQLLGFDTGATDGDSLSEPDARARAAAMLDTAIPAAVPGARLRVEAAVRGDRLVRLKIDPDFEDAFQSAEVAPRKTSREVVGALAFTLVVSSAIYSLLLFRRRSREQEVPRERLQLLVAVYGVVGVLYVTVNFDVPLVGGGSEGLGLWIALVIAMFSAVFFFLAGLLLAIAYAGGEGEIREGYPGKLTSFDALIAGKPWSRNAALSVVSGAACAAWAFFLLAAVARLSSPAASMLVPESLLFSALGRMPLAGLLLRQPILVTWTVVSGLLVPATFCRRRGLRPRTRSAVLFCAPFLIGLGFRPDSLSAVPPFAEVAIAAAALALPFLHFDLLAAITSAVLYHLLSDATLLAPVSSNWWSLGGAAIVLTALALLPFLKAARSGAVVTEDEVAPRYVANLERRLSLQAEVGAARLAQLRLLPQSPPNLPGLSVAAACLPAGEVGGDFYDFYPLGSGELALFVASASGSSVASALTIALAKGFLVCDLCRADGPVATLRRLRDLLLQSLGPAGDQLAIALAIVDPRCSSVRAARVGSTPELWILRRDGSLAEILFHAPAQPGVDEAQALFAPGDTLLVHTPGLIRLLEDQSPSGVRDWMRAFARRVAGASAAHSLDALLDRVGGRKRKRLAPARLRRDLTSVVVRFEEAS